MSEREQDDACRAKHKELWQRPVVTGADVFKSKMDFCGCGDPGAAMQFVMDILAVLDARETETHDVNWPKLVALLPDGDSGKNHFVLYMLEHFGLTDHGSSVWGSRLTKEGKGLLEFMRRFPKEMWDAEDDDLEEYDFYNAGK